MATSSGWSEELEGGEDWLEELCASAGGRYCGMAPKGAEQHTGAYPEAQPPAGAAPPARPPHQDEVDDLLSVLQDLEGSVPSSLLQFTARSGGPGAPPSAPVAEQRAEQAAEPPAAGPGLPGDADLLRAVAAMGASQGRRNFRLPPLVPGMGLNRAAAANGGAANSNTAWASMQPGPAPAVLAAQQQQQQDQPPAEGKAAGGATGYANYEMDKVASAAFAFFPSPKWEDAPAAAAQGQPQQPEPTRLAAGVTDGSLGTAPHPASPADRPSPFQAAASPAAGPAAAAAAEDGSGSEVSGLPAAPLREARAPSSVEEGLDTGQPGGSGSGKEDARREKARLASRQFRARQKENQAQVKADLENLQAQIEREREAAARARESHAAIELLLQYQEEMQEALRAANEGMQPIHQVPAELVALLAEFDVANSEGLHVEEMLRYNPAGYTANLGPDGRVREPPPAEKVAEDWGLTVAALKAVAAEAQEAGRSIVHQMGERALPGAQAPQQDPNQAVPWDMVQQHAQQTMSRLHRLLHWNRRRVMEGQGQVVEVSSQGLPPSELGLSGRGSGDMDRSSSGASSVAGACSGDASGGAAGQRRQQSPGLRSGSGGSLDAAAGAEAESDSCELSQRLSSLEITPEQEQAAIEAAAAALEVTRLQQQLAGGAEAQGEAETERELQAAAALVRRQLVVAALIGGKPWSLVDGGLVVWAQEGAYCFTGEQLKRVSAAFKRAGALLWQQVLFFPDNLRRLGMMHLGYMTPSSTDPAHWDGVVASLQLGPAQVKELRRLYDDYCNKLEPARQRCAAAIERLKEVQVGVAAAGGQSASAAAQGGLDMRGATDMLKQAMLAEHVAYTALMAGFFRVLHYPLQKIKSIANSWPYFPQVDQLLAAAARQQGDW